MSVLGRRLPLLPLLLSFSFIGLFFIDQASLK
jgi:hypothetical protein